MMKARTMIMFMLTCATALAADLSVNDLKCTRDDDGTFLFSSPDGKQTARMTLVVHGANKAEIEREKWEKVKVSEKPVSGWNENNINIPGNTVEFTTTSEAAGLQVSELLRREHDKLYLRYRVFFPESWKNKVVIAPKIVLTGELAPLKGSLVGISENRHTFLLPGSGKLNVANSLVLPGFPLFFSFFRHPVQFTGEEDLPKYKAELHLKKDNGVPELSYSIEFRVTGEKRSLKMPEDPVKAAIGFYSELLHYPVEPRWNPDAARAMLSAPGAGKTEIKKLEQLLALRSRLYTLGDVWNHREIYARLSGEKLESPVSELLDAAYAKLNALDLAGAKALETQLRNAIGDKREWMPLTKFNPFGWKKNFMTLQMRWHREGHNTNPSPFLVEYQDGATFRLVESDAVRVVNSADHKERLLTCRFLKPVPGLTVQRDWIGDAWRLNGTTYRFNVLTPLIDVDNADQLTLSDIDPAFNQLTFVQDNAEPMDIPLVNHCIMAFKGKGSGSETVTNDALFTVSSTTRGTPGTYETSRHALTLNFKADALSRPFVILRGDRGLSLILILGSQPEEISWTSGKLTVKLKKKSFFSILRPSPELSSLENFGVAEFFARVAVALPVEAMEYVDGDRVSCKYGYLERRSDWEVTPLKIAPVPQLAVLAELPVQGAEKIKQNTRYGWFRYKKGDSCSYTIPAACKTPFFRGTNSGIRYSNTEEIILDYAKNNCGPIRLFLYNAPNEEDVYSQVEHLLKLAVDNNIKYIIEPHYFRFKTMWGHALPTDGIGQQNFLKMWDRLSALCAKYPAAIYAYEPYNEHGLRAGADPAWRELCEQAAAIIRRNHPGKPIYMDCLLGSAYRAMVNFEAVSGNCVPSFHFYWPGAFTHQNMLSENPGRAGVFYPGYFSHQRGENWADRWIMAGKLLPALEYQVLHPGVPLHCGEFGIYNDAERTSPGGALNYTRDFVEALEASGIQWNIWYDGFGMRVQAVREYIIRKWNSPPPYVP